MRHLQFGLFISAGDRQTKKAKKIPIQTPVRSVAVKRGGKSGQCLVRLTSRKAV